MNDSIPKTQKQWVVDGRNGFDSLKLDNNAPLPEVGSRDVLVIFQGASLNYRDLITPKGKCTYQHGFMNLSAKQRHRTIPVPLADKFIPGSDGAGTVVAVGDKVQRFKPGDKVITLFNQGHIDGTLDGTSVATGLGVVLDGTFRQFGAFGEEGLVHMPEGLTFPEASCLTCAGLTAWNGLYGLAGKQVKPGDWVLTQGTGGVSLFAVQFAKAAGARVVATIGSADKVSTLTNLGADHVINYNENSEWGKKAKELSGGAGMNHVIEVAGPKSMQQSLDSIAIGGVISIIGFIGGRGGEKEPSFLNALQSICIVRGILVGNRVQMEDMCRAVEANIDKLRPIVDAKSFWLDQLKDAYEHQWSAKHIGKVVIEI